jgi:hypothetical protein
LPTTHLPFFTGETALDGNWYYLRFANGTPFGYYSYLPDQDFTYHIDLGYEYLFGAYNAIVVSTSMILPPARSFTPVRVSSRISTNFSLNAWLYYLPDASNPGRYTRKPR